MSGKVIQFSTEPADGGPHVTGEVRCTACGNEWVAVAPVGTTWLECPACGTMRALFRYKMFPAAENGSKVWVCVCGEAAFYITPDGTYCYACGSRQEFP
jgi:hypothetical protein